MTLTDDMRVKAEQIRGPSRVLVLALLDAAETALTIERDRVRELRAALRVAHATMQRVEVFVTSRQRIKSPEGEEWYTLRVNDIARLLASYSEDGGTKEGAAHE